jgi:hypothetical protein
MSATRELIRDTILATPVCPDGSAPLACASCLSSAIEIALAVGVPPAPDADVDVIRALCLHDWPGELSADAECSRCGLSYGAWSE